MGASASARSRFVAVTMTSSTAKGTCSTGGASGAVLGEDACHGFDDLVDMRVRIEQVRRHLPKRREARIGERQLAVGAEHRDAFVERVEGRALHVELGLVLAAPKLGYSVIKLLAAMEQMRLKFPDRMPVGFQPLFDT